MTNPFTSKQAAKTAAENHHVLAGPVWVGPADTFVLKLPVGWYVGCPGIVDYELHGKELVA